jgi:hypothetical protein
MRQKPKVTELSAEARVNKLVQKAKLPTFDPQSVLDRQKNNFAAFSAARQAAGQGAQAILLQQQLFLKQTFQKGVSISQGLKPSLGALQPTCGVAHDNLIQQTLDVGFAIANNVAATAVKSNGNALSFIQQQVNARVDEIASTLPAKTIVAQK